MLAAVFVLARPLAQKALEPRIRNLERLFLLRFEVSHLTDVNIVHSNTASIEPCCQTPVSPLVINSVEKRSGDIGYLYLPRLVRGEKLSILPKDGIEVASTILMVFLREPMVWTPFIQYGY